MSIRALSPLLLLLALAASGCYAHASAGGHARGPSLVWVDTHGVWVVEHHHHPVFYTHDYYWRYEGGVWYRASTFHADRWQRVRVSVVPRALVRIDRPRRYADYEGSPDARRRRAGEAGEPDRDRGVRPRGRGGEPPPGHGGEVPGRAVGHDDDRPGRGAEPRGRGRDEAGPPPGRGAEPPGRGRDEAGPPPGRGRDEAGPPPGRGRDEAGPPPGRGRPDQARDDRDDDGARGRGRGGGNDRGRGGPPPGRGGGKPER